MAIIGQNLQAGLGRIDYAPYLQGAMQGVQGTVAGAQGIAQGISAIGQGAAKGIQDYLKKQEEAKQEEEASSMVTRILKTNPGLSSQLGLVPNEKGEFDQGAIKAAIKGAGGPANTIKFAATLEELSNQQKDRKDQQSALAYSNLLSQGGGKVPDVVSRETLSQFSDKAKSAGKSLYLQQEMQQAQLKKTQAETNVELAKARTAGASKFMGKIYESPQEAQNAINDMKKAGLFLPGQTPTFKAESGGYVIETGGSQVPDPEVEARSKIMQKIFEQNIQAGDTARNLAPGINELSNLFKQGLDTNRLTPFKIRALSFAKAVGMTVDEQELSKLETAETYMAQQILGFFQQTKGSVSNKENDLFAMMGANIQKSAETNRRLLSIISERLRLDAQIADIVKSGIADGLSFGEIERRKKEVIDQYDKKLPTLSDIGINVDSVSSAQPSVNPLGLNQSALDAEMERRGLKSKQRIGSGR